MQGNYSMSEKAPSLLVPPYDNFTDKECTVVRRSHHHTVRAIGPKPEMFAQV